MSASPDDDYFGPITSEFIANINSGLARTITRAGSAPEAKRENSEEVGGGGRLKRRSYKRTREDVTSRSRTEIINWVLGNEELIKVCICPYCLKIHSRRDNARVHMKNQHPGMAVRDFDRKRDASLEEVRLVNNIGKFHRPSEKRPAQISPLPLLTSNDLHHIKLEEPEEIKVFNAPTTLQDFLIDIDKQVRRQRQEQELQEFNGSIQGEASTSGTIPNSSKGSRDQSPSESLVNGTTSSSSPFAPPALPFGCVICPCSFPRISDLTAHLDSTHRTRYRCNTCLAEFVQPAHLEHHFAISHVISSDK